MNIEDRYREVLDRIRLSCEKVGRNPTSVHLIAVSKMQSVEKIQELYNLGHRDFGESKVQELLVKVDALPKDIRWHFIGTLQSNKLRKAAEVCDVIHSIDSESQLKEIRKIGSSLNLFVQVNIGDEPQKSGVDKKGLDSMVASVLNCSQASLLGLMTIGPAVEDAEAMRPYFAEMRSLNERVGGKWLSMGMSSDFDVAVQEGSTHIRVGSLLFGDRY
jgi:pyridoxal phosphate enzyme (YggS family)